MEGTVQQGCNALGVDGTIHHRKIPTDYRGLDTGGRIHHGEEPHIHKNQTSGHAVGHVALALPLDERDSELGKHFDPEWGEGVLARQQ